MHKLDICEKVNDHLRNQMSVRKEREFHQAALFKVVIHLPVLVHNSSMTGKCEVSRFTLS